MTKENIVELIVRNYDTDSNLILIDSVAPKEIFFETIL